MYTFFDWKTYFSGQTNSDAKKILVAKIFDIYIYNTWLSDFMAIIYIFNYKD